MNLVIKSFILALLAVSNVNAANIRGTRRTLTDSCHVNRDCPSNHICQFRGREARGTCVRRNAPSSSLPTSYSSSADTCRRNDDCPDPDTQRCNDAGYCVINNRMVPRSGDTCTKNGECGANRICGDNGHCQRRDMEFEGAMEQY